ncbi:MAG: serine/threonine-protein kinase, partial [Gemmatimonadaceae bacterium]
MTFFGAVIPTGVGELESEYDLLGELGRGGMAVVYRARERATGRDVAVKVVRVGATSDAVEAHARFAREAQTVAQLQHPNIVATYGLRPLASGGLGIVMQLVPGRTLKEVVRDGGPLSAGRTADILRQVASALAYAHAKGVVHRDVKPENIFLDERSGTALLSDFGIARTLEQDAALTQTGIAIGTPTYMSPEQIDGRSVDGRGDIYSLGLVGWEMLTGRQPWEGESLYSVIYKQKHEELPAIADLRHDVPDGLQYVVERALVKDREQRWQTADEVVRQLTDGADPAAVRAWRLRRARRLRPELAAALDREAMTSETLRFERPRAAIDPDDLAGFYAARRDERAAGARRSRAVTAGAAALLIALAGATALTLRGRASGPSATGHTESGHRATAGPPPSPAVATPGATAAGATAASADSAAAPPFGAPLSGATGAGALDSAAVSGADSQGALASAPFGVDPAGLVGAGVAAARQEYGSGALRQRLAPFHRDVDAAFHGWNDVWLTPAMR